MKRLILVLGVLAALGACSRGEDPSVLFGDNAAATGGADSVIGPDGQPIQVTSLTYFDQVIGDSVLFEVDQATLTTSAREILDQQAAWMLQRPDVQISIEGHADEQGTREYNFRLSARRASAVRDYLVTRGIPDARLSTIPFGKERPIEVCSEERCWAQNRRAVTVVTGGSAGV